MDTIPRNDFILRNRYDAFCKAVLRNEAKDYLHEMGRQRDREKSLDALTQQELDKLSTVDQYPSDSYIFSSHGYDLLINNELVAEAFASLPEQEQSILILHCVLEMVDGEIGSLMGMSRSAVQRAPQDKHPETVAREIDGVNAGREVTRMKQPTFNGRELLPLSVMEAAHAGDAIAMEQVLRYYECYINKLCTRTLYDSNGIPYVCVDEYMKRRLEIKLIHAIVVDLK